MKNPDNDIESSTIMRTPDNQSLGGTANTHWRIGVPWRQTPKINRPLFLRIYIFWRKRRDLLHPPKKIFCQTEMSIA